MLVRQITEDDVEELVKLCRSQVEETLPHMPFDSDVVRHYALWSITAENPNFAVWIALGDDGQGLGYLVGTVTPYFFCDGVSVNQEVLYVRPDKRGGLIAKCLMQQLDAWAETHGALEVYAGIANGFQPERTAAFLSRSLGYEPVGYYLRKIRHAVSE